MTKKKISPTMVMLILVLIAFVGCPRRILQPRPVLLGTIGGDDLMGTKLADSEREALVREAKLQTKAIMRLGIWQRLGLLAPGCWHPGRMVGVPVGRTGLVAPRRYHPCRRLRGRVGRPLRRYQTCQAKRQEHPFCRGRGHRVEGRGLGQKRGWEEGVRFGPKRDGASKGRSSVLEIIEMISWGGERQGLSSPRPYPMSYSWRGGQIWQA